MEQRLYIKVDGGSGGGAKITAQLDGVLFFEAIGSAPDNLTYDVYIGSAQTNQGNVDLLVTPPADNTSALVISLSGALTETVNVPAPTGGTGAGYNAFERTYIIGGQAGGISPDLARYFELGENAYFSGTSIIVTGDRANVTVKEAPPDNTMVFDVQATEYELLSRQFYLCDGTGSTFQYWWTGVPAVGGNANGVYYDNVSSRSDYNGVLTFQVPVNELPYTMTIAAGNWQLRDIAPPDPDQDPYDKGGPSGTGGGVSAKV